MNKIDVSPDRKITPLRELGRYEKIFDYYLENFDNKEIFVMTNSNTKKFNNLDYLVGVLDEAYKIYRDDKVIDLNKQIRDRIYPKMIKIKVKLLNKLRDEQC